MTTGDTKSLTLDRIRIATDEFEDDLVAKLTDLRAAIRSGDIAQSDELVTELLDQLTIEGPTEETEE